MTRPCYLKTNSMAQLIGYSGDFLLKNRNILFFENIHYFTKEARINWKVSEMVAWIENENATQKAKDVLKLLSS